MNCCIMLRSKKCALGKDPRFWNAICIDSPTSVHHYAKFVLIKMPYKVSVLKKLNKLNSATFLVA